MSDYTKGPWKVVRNGFWNMGVQDSKGNWLTYKAGEDFMGERVVEANARLIAASPDLLEALIGVVRVADRETDEFIAARKAISKAQGSNK